MLRVMTFNLLYSEAEAPPRAEGDIVPSWARRRPACRAALGEADAHLIGTQEGRHIQMRDIETDLEALAPGRYVGLGEPREPGPQGEFNRVLIDTARLVVLESGTVWLTPLDQPRSANASARIATWARLRDRTTGSTLIHVNTHLEWSDESARAAQATLLLDRFAHEAGPVIITGDCNEVAGGGVAYDQFLDAGFVDAWTAAAERGPDYGSFHGFAPLKESGNRIDWVMVSQGWDVLSAAWLTTSVDGVPPSDHLPLVVTLGDPPTQAH